MKKKVTKKGNEYTFYCVLGATFFFARLAATFSTADLLSCTQVITV